MFKKSIALILTLTVLLGCFSVGASASKTTVSAVSASSSDVAGEKNYTISNPYESVKWGEWREYKASLHSHTNASDAEPSIEDSIEYHYSDDYDILALSDHAVIGTTWDAVPTTVPLYRFFKFHNTQMADIKVLTPERRAELLAGVGRMNADGTPQPMLEITGASELNGATPINDCHVNGFFMDEGKEWGQARMGIYGDYETVVKNVEKRGGITFLDHTGEYVGCENDPERAMEPYYANKFANIFLNYPSCVGMDVNSGKNNRTKYDYILWDNTLKLTLPYGRNVFCFCFSDGHHLDEYERGFTYMCMPELTSEALRTCMETGAFFSCSHFDRADLGDEFDGTGTPVPYVSCVDVNNDTDTLSFEAEGFDCVRWYSNGELIASGSDLTSLDLNEYEDKISLYVRFTLTGPGGVLYSQAFPVSAEGEETEKPAVVPTYDLPGFFRVMADLLNALIGWTPLVLIVRKVLWGYLWWL